jgi:hypothetical protein
MNYYAHGRDWLDDPWFVAGTAVPDWLNVADRGVRARGKHASQWVDDADPRVASIARGIVQHHRDDAWFHGTAAFTELQWRLTADVQSLLGDDPSLRASFIGHILVELLLDSVLVERDPTGLKAYYRTLESVDGEVISRTVAAIAGKPCPRLPMVVAMFSREAFLWDYLDDAKLCIRLNQVMRRVRLTELPERFRFLLPEARRLVRSRELELLTPSEAAPLVSPRGVQ